MTKCCIQLQMAKFPGFFQDSSWSLWNLDCISILRNMGRQATKDTDPSFCSLKAIPCILHFLVEFLDMLVHLFDRGVHDLPHVTAGKESYSGLVGRVTEQAALRRNSPGEVITHLRWEKPISDGATTHHLSLQELVHKNHQHLEV